MNDCWKLILVDAINGSGRQFKILNEVCWMFYSSCYELYSNPQRHLGNRLLNLFLVMDGCDRLRRMIANSKSIPYEIRKEVVGFETMGLCGKLSMKDVKTYIKTKRISHPIPDDVSVRDLNFVISNNGKWSDRGALLRNPEIINDSTALSRAVSIFSNGRDQFNARVVSLMSLRNIAELFPVLPQRLLIPLFKSRSIDECFEFLRTIKHKHYEHVKLAFFAAFHNEIDECKPTTRIDVNTFFTVLTHKDLKMEYMWSTHDSDRIIDLFLNDIDIFTASELDYFLNGLEYSQLFYYNDIVEKVIDLCISQKHYVKPSLIEELLLVFPSKMMNYFDANLSLSHANHGKLEYGIVGGRFVWNGRFDMVIKHFQGIGVEECRRKFTFSYSELLLLMIENKSIPLGDVLTFAESLKIKGIPLTQVNDEHFQRPYNPAKRPGRGRY